MNEYNLEKFNKELEQLKLTLNEQQISQFLMFYEKLTEWNSFMNLTTVTKFDEVFLKHFADSLSIVNGIDMSEIVTMIDVGTGAGFPGIPLKIAFPHLKVTLLDSLGKRVKFLNEVITVLKLEEIRAVHGRAEDFAKDPKYREKYDLCVSRAVANLSSLSEYCLPYVKKEGTFVSYKAKDAEDEATKAQKAIHVMGGELIKILNFQLPESDINRSLIIIEKKRYTPKSYPRKAGLPGKDPIK